MKRPIAILLGLSLCLLVAYYVYSLFYLPNELNEPIGQEHIKDAYIQLNKQSERNEGNRSITVYRSLDGKIWVSVVKSHEQSDVSPEELTKEIERFADAPLKYQWNDLIPTHTIDNHTAVSTQLIEVDSKSDLPTYSVPDKYVTAIGYPEKNTVLLVMSNGENVTWDIQGEMVNRFRL